MSSFDNFQIELALGNIANALQSIAITYARMVDANLATIKDAKERLAVIEDRDQKAFAALVELAQGRASNDEGGAPPGASLN